LCRRLRHVFALLVIFKRVTKLKIGDR
jgi:hypothetical protein